MSDQPTPAGMITVAQACALLGLTDERLRQLSRAGHIPKAVDGRYPLVGLVQGYIAFLKSEERRTTKSASASRVQDMRAAEIAMRMEERSGALVAEAVREATATFDALAGGLRSDLLAVPARVTLDVTLRAKIETEIDDAFRAAAKRAEAALAAPAPGGDPVGAAPAKPARRVGARRARVPGKRRPARPA